MVATALLSEARARAVRLGNPGADEALHDFRVSVRRLRSALREWRGVLGRGVRDKDLRRLDRAARATGEARDAEVLLAWVERAAQELPPAQRTAAAWLGRRLARKTREADLPASGERFVAATRSLSRRLAGEPAPSSGETFAGAVAARIREHASRVASRLSGVETLADARRAHRARIEGKRLRYLLESLRGMAGAGPEPALGALRRLQDLLGELNDALVAVEVLRAARRESAGKTGEPGLRPSLAALERLATRRAETAFARVGEAVLPHRGRALLDPSLTVAAALETRAARRTRPRPRKAPRSRARKRNPDP